MDWQNKKVVVIGFGDTGIASATWLKQHGAQVSLADSRLQPPNLAEAQALSIPLLLGAFTDETFAQADVLVVSPGVPVATPAISAFRDRGGAVIGDVEVWARAIKGTGSKVIAITGSNGKTTVTSLTGFLCKQAGLKTEIAGNIGLPVLAALSQWEARGELPEVWVVELSSFQLETTDSLSADAATVLNISEDHLDRYQDLLAYACAKSAVFNGQGIQVLNADDGFCHAMTRPNRAQVWFSLNQTDQDFGLLKQADHYFITYHGEAIFDLANWSLQGLHNAANAMAALALCLQIGLDLSSLVRSLPDFKGLSHRVEAVATVNGVLYIDDSKGTNVGATEAALKGMTAPVVLIAGGEGKGQDFRPLAGACQSKVKAVVLIGKDAKAIEQALESTTVPCYFAPTLEAATKMAADLARVGDIVLLSPACASLDMFRNYAHRSAVFVQAVKQLSVETEQ